ncbi:MAG: hypothetical protein Q8L68_04290 [Methylococcales bacterium]|nr:hypothetical protein [Methylococcales bacterium]
MTTNNSWNSPNLISDGQLLIGSSTGRPVASFLTSSAQTISIITSHGGINIDLFQPVSILFGGTGRTVLTTFGVLIGEGSNGVNVTAAGTSGQVLIASTTGDPAFSTITSSGGSVVFASGPNSLNIEVNFAGSSFFNPLQVANGGTGRTVLTTFGLLIGEGSNGVNVTAAGTDGQVIIASTTGDPAFSTITSSGGSVVFASGPNSLNIEVNFAGSSFFNPLQVANGGTGRTVLTTFGVLIGEGSNGVNVTAAGTSGQVLIASTTGDPAFSTITSSGGSVTFAFGPNSLNIEVAAAGFTFVVPWTVPFGGTGRTVLTTFGVLIGEGSNGVDVTAAGTSGQVLIASTTGDPAFSTITSSGNTLTFTFGPNSLNIDINVDGFTFVDPWTVPLGGTGRTVLTTFGVLIGEGSNNIDVTAAGTDGQVLIAGTSVDPAFATITSSSGTIVFTPGSNSLNLDVVGGGIPWIFTSVATDLANNTGYVATNNGSSVAFTLPLTASQGTIIRINGIGTAGWSIATNPSASSQVIHFGTLDSTTTTPIISTEKGDAIELLCVAANTDWSVLSAQGNMDIS